MESIVFDAAAGRWVRLCNPSCTPLWARGARVGKGLSPAVVGQVRYTRKKRRSRSFAHSVCTAIERGGSPLPRRLLLLGWRLLLRRRLSLRLWLRSRTLLRSGLSLRLWLRSRALLRGGLSLRLWLRSRTLLRSGLSLLRLWLRSRTLLRRGLSLRLWLRSGRCCGAGLACGCG